MHFELEPKDPIEPKTHTWIDIVRIMRFVSKTSDIYDFAHECTSDRIIYVLNIILKPTRSISG